MSKKTTNPINTKSVIAMKYQVERAKIGSESWEQMPPQVNHPNEAAILVEAEKVKNNYLNSGYHFRVVCHTREFCLFH